MNMLKLVRVPLRCKLLRVNFFAIWMESVPLVVLLFDLAFHVVVPETRLQNAAIC